ncbi:MAG: FHA domain-containing protein [Phycisphaerae bacterium]
MSTSQPSVSTIPRLPGSAQRAFLEVVHRDETGRKIECSRVVTLIGSRNGCKMMLKHESVDPVHLAIVHDGTQVRAADLMSARGTILNQLKLEQDILHDGDRLTVSAWEFRVSIPEPPTSVLGDSHQFELDPSPLAVALQHVETGQVLHPQRDICIIGRRKGSDIHINSRYVSRAHALLITYMGHPAIVDLLSSHHTYVNGQPTMFTVLKNDDVIGIGDAKFRVLAVGPNSVNEGTAGKSHHAATDSQATAGTGQDGTARPSAPTPDAAPDKIDIEHVEGSQRWRIADNYDKLTKQSK